MARKYIHNFEGHMRGTLDRIERSDLPPSDKDLLIRFSQHCAAEGAALPYQLKLTSDALAIAIRFIRKPLRSVTKRDIDATIVPAIESTVLRPWTKNGQKRALRKLFKFVVWGPEGLHRPGYPPIVKDVSVRMRRQDKFSPIRRADLLTPDEAERLIERAPDTQMRALVMILYETGARINEIGMIDVGDVTRDKYSFILDVDGKTGRRPVRIILAGGALTSWLNCHPKRDKPAAPLWGSWFNQEWKRLSYFQIEKRVKRIAVNAGVKKRVHTHLFRHGRFTEFLDSNSLSIPNINRYLGLAVDSPMHRIYGHTTNKSANDAVLQMHGITREKPKSILAPDKCRQCGTLNEKSARFCAMCGNALNLQAAEDGAGRTEKAGDLLLRYLGQPSENEDFRRWVREELREEIREQVQQQVADALPPQSAPRREPTPRRRKAA